MAREIRHALVWMERDPTVLRTGLGPQRQSPLHYACLVGNDGAIKQMCAAGAEPDRADATGLTPLHLSFKYRSN